MTGLELSHDATRNAQRAAIRRALLVVNPASRRGYAALARVTAALDARGVEHVVARTQAPGHATSLVREHLAASPDDPFDVVFALGGDGTAMEVASGLSEHDSAPPLGILAVGTANVLARSLGIPMEPVAALTALMDARHSTIDLGRVEGGPAFAIGLGVGLDAAMIGGASSLLKQRVGYAAYALSAMRAGLRLERFDARITVDGVVHDVTTSSVLVANFGTVLGDMICFGERIGYQDGMLDVCVYSPRSIPDAVRIFWRMLFGGVSDDRCVTTIRGRSVRVETSVPRPIQADGEMLGLTPVEMHVEPAAVRVLVPRAGARRWPFRRHEIAA